MKIEKREKERAKMRMIETKKGGENELRTAAVNAPVLAPEK